MSTPLVSIVTPSYDQAPYLEETIRSVLEQDYEPIEYIVVDGGSTDGSVEIVRRYEHRLAWWTSEPDRGQPHALNKGFARASGELMGFVNSDDTLLPGAVAKLVAALERAPDALAAYGDCLFVDDTTGSRTLMRPGPWDVASMMRRAAGTVMQPSSLWRRRAWELAGPFEESYDAVFDSLFFVKLALAGPAAYVPEPLATFRLHGASKTVNPIGAARAEELVRVADEFYRDMPPALRGPVRLARAGYYRRAAWTYFSLGDKATARRLLLRSLRLKPWMSRRTARLLAKAVLPDAALRLRRRLRRR